MNDAERAIIRKHYQRIGRKGGSVKSAAKTAAVRANAKKPRGKRAEKKV